MTAQDTREEDRPGTRRRAAPPGGPAPDAPPALRAHRRRDTKPVSRVYSRFVTAMKFSLPALALAVLAMLAAWPSLNNLPRPRIGADKGQLEMIKPRYFSADEHNQPFSVVAAQADQSADQPGIIVLEKPEAEMTEKEGTWVNIRSDKGWYNQETGILKMRGNVRVMRDDGNEFTTTEADTDVRKGTAWGDQHVTGQGPQGEINAQGFRLSDRGKTMVFLNQSKAEVQAAERPGGKKR